MTRTTVALATTAAVILAAATPASARVDFDCDDFASQQAAQAFYEAHQPGDPHRLDADHDGLACEWNAQWSREPFDDVPHGYVHADNIALLVAVRVVVGYPDGTFRPTAPLTQRQVYTIRERVDGRPAGAGNTSKPATRRWIAEKLCGSVDRAVALGVLRGFSDGELRLWRSVTRAQATSMVVRFASSDG